MNFRKASIFQRDTEKPEEQNDSGGMLAVWGSPGSGKTVTAAKIAKMLSARKKNVILLLCDMAAPMLPCICPADALESNGSLAGVLAAARISENLIKHNLVTFKRNSCLAVLGLLERQNEYSTPPFTQKQVVELLDGLRQIAPYVIVDCGSYIANDILSAVALMEADSILRLANCDPKSVNYFASQLPLLDGPEWDMDKQYTLMPTAVSLWAFLRPVRNPAAAAPHFRDLQPTKFQNTEEPYMGFNYAAEKKKFETLWARLRREYRAAGMSDTAIQKMHDFDWEVFKQERIYRLHTQDLGIGIFDEPSAEQEDKSALMKKFLESVSRWDDYTTASRYGWIEGIGDQRLVRVLKRLSISEKELLTKYCIEDKTQQEIAAEMGLSQRAVGKQLQQLKNFFRKF